MAYDISIKQEAIKLREAGYSIKEIAQKLNIAISSSSVWLRNVKITTVGKDRMVKHKEENRYKISQNWEEKRQKQQEIYLEIAKTTLDSLDLNNKILTKVICAILFWAEGSKRINHIAFTNSDPIMMKTFMSLLRNSYSLDETKFHISVHLHEYHDPMETLQFWSRITKVPSSQFIKPYLKPHTSTRKHANYKGCITVRYYDVKIARELTAIYNALGDKY